MSFINAIKKTGFFKFKSRKCKRLYLEFSPFPPHFYRPLYPSLLRRPTPPIFQDLPTSEEAKKRKEKENVPPAPSPFSFLSSSCSSIGPTAEREKRGDLQICHPEKGDLS